MLVLMRNRVEEGVVFVISNWFPLLFLGLIVAGFVRAAW
jgi:hypothetical protein